MAHRRQLSVLSTFVALVATLLCTENVMSATVGNMTEKTTSLPEQPPLVFPEDDTKYKIISNNLSIINTLSHANNGSSNSEIYDMIHSPIMEEHVKNNNSVEISNMELPKPSLITNTEVPLNVLKLEVNPKLQSEQIQSVGAYVEKDYHRNQRENLHNHSGIWAVAAISITLIIVGVAYIGLVIYRRIRILRYGSRQILNNEEDSVGDFKYPEL